MKAIAIYHASTFGSFWNEAVQLKSLSLVNSDEVENDLALPGIFFYYWNFKNMIKLLYLR